MKQQELSGGCPNGDQQGLLRPPSEPDSCGVGICFQRKNLDSHTTEVERCLLEKEQNYVYI